MLVECVCIILLILLMAFVFLRAHRKEYALTTLPLVILPLMHLLSFTVAHHIAKIMPLDTNGVTVAFDATALVISCTILGVLSNKITAKRAKIAYLVVCGTFVVLLTWVLISNTLAH